MNIYISAIKDFLDLDGFELLPLSRRERILRAAGREDKARLLVAGLLLRKFCGVTNDDVLAYNEKSKPYLKKGGWFSLSHSGDYVILAVCESEIGADIEKIRDYPKRVAKRCFTPTELLWFDNDNIDSAGRNKAFFEIWTAKESIMKATGLGFSLPMKNFEVLPFGSPVSADNKLWQINWCYHDGHIICYATEDKASPVELIVVSGLVSGE